MKVMFIILGAVVLLLCVDFLVALTWRVPVHNANLRAFERSFESVLHPTQSTLHARHAEFGNFGNSNHCDYFVGEFRSSPLQRSEIARHYAGKTIRSPDITQHAWDGEPPAESEIEVYFTDDDVFEWYPWSEWLGKVKQRPETGEAMYLAFALEDGYPPRGDFRCH